MIIDALSLAVATLKLKKHCVTIYCLLLSSLVENVVDTGNVCQVQNTSIFS